MASASDPPAHPALQPADQLILPPQPPPPAVETSIGPPHCPPEAPSQTRSFNRACAPARGTQTLIRLNLPLLLSPLRSNRADRFWRAALRRLRPFPQSSDEGADPEGALDTGSAGLAEGGTYLAVATGVDHLADELGVARQNAPVDGTGGGDDLA